MAKPTVKQIFDLPKGVLVKDLDWPKYSPSNRVLHDSTFELWYVQGLGWVIPTLHIQNPGRRAMPGVVRRTYSIGVKDSKVYTVGMGPHVQSTCTVYVTEKTKDRLQFLVDLKAKGMEDAGKIRDRISTRRANTALRRANLGW